MRSESTQTPPVSAKEPRLLPRRSQSHPIRQIAGEREAARRPATTAASSLHLPTGSGLVITLPTLGKPTAVMEPPRASAFLG